jgi:hypothetical protein
MIARRLLILMLVMLIIASISSVFVAEPGRRGSAPPPASTTEARETPPNAPPSVEGRLLRETLDASAEKPRAIRMRVGDQLALRIEARRVLQVEVTGFGQLEDVVPPAPARFDLYADRPGRFPVRLLPTKREIGVIQVGQAAKSKRG